MWRNLLAVSALQGPVSRRHILNGRIDENEIRAQGVSECDQIFPNVLLLQEDQNFGVLSLARDIKKRHSAISHHFAYRPLGQRPTLRFGKVGGVDKWIMDRSLNHGWQPSPLRGNCIA